MKPPTKFDSQRVAGSAPPPCSAVECWARHSIMDGKVVTYSTSFEGDGHFPNPKEATGHFEVSASRNCVMVHRARIQTDWQLETFKSALDAANRMHCELARCDGRPEWKQPPAYRSEHERLYMERPPRQVWDGEKWVSQPNAQAQATPTPNDSEK